jgi:hypothetical protein
MNYGHAQPSIALVEQPRQQGPPGANLFVFRIPDDFTDENLKETFARFGNLLWSSCFQQWPWSLWSRSGQEVPPL